MEILIDNPLATMYGPYFLVFFGFIIFFAVIILAIVKSQFDKTNNLPLPAIPHNIDPYEIAYLRGGTNEVARSVIFSLLKKGFIEIDSSILPAVIKKTDNQNDFRSLAPIEQLTLGWLGAERQPKEVFGSYGLVEQLKVYADSYQGRLENQQMLTSEDDRAVFRPVKWSVYMLIAALGGYKLLASIAHGYYNIIFLICFLVAGLLIARAVAKIPRVTKLGKAYLERLQNAFDSLKYSAQAANRFFNPVQAAPQTTFPGVDPMLLSVGVFGSAVLAGTVYDDYNQAFQRSQAASAAGGGSCGSACGSSCSSTSSCSSSDGGGSSCGSGCGGGCGGGGD
jgi:uncharacterized protein (TIGR04222 family)